MKIILIFFVLFSSVNLLHAQSFTLTGKIEKVRTHAHPSVADVDWISLENLTSLGTCPVDSASGLVALKIRDSTLGDRQIAIAMTAKMGGVPVQIVVNDLIKTNGFCYLNQIDL